MLPAQLRLPYRPREAVEARRDAAIRRIVAHAARTVPHYRELFARSGIDPREIRTIADLERLPLVDKELVQADPERFRAQSAAGRTAVPFVTSGSTGMPLTIYHDRDSLLASLAWNQRERVVEAKLCGKLFRYRRVAIVWTIATAFDVIAFHEKNTFAPLRPKGAFLDVASPLEEQIAAINRLRPDVLAGYGAHLELLFRVVAARKLRLHLPQVVVYGADLMTDEGRRFIEDTFGIPVISAYNAVEAFKIAFTCEERNGFHVHEDLCAVRLVDGDGTSVAAGASGEVVITNLVNRGTVLLNYRLGDVAAFDDTPCACGRTLRRLAGLEGRIAEYIRRHDGQYVGSSEITKRVTSREGVLKYQLVQHEEQHFELKLQTTSAEVYERIKDGLVAELRELLGADVRIDVGRHDQIEPGPRGKFRRVFSLFEPAQAR